MSNSDNTMSRRMTETCAKKNETILNPVIDWTEGDVWEYIRERGLPYNPLYDMGHRRVGCIGCPMKKNRRELEENPRWAALYKRAGEKHLDSLSGERKDYQKDIETYYNWWLNFCNGGTGNKLTPKERLLFGEPALETIKEQGDSE
jgi:phosphoadenosine phosphosulfate reductase